MKINSTTPVSFRQQNPDSGKVRGPRTYRIQDSIVTLTSEEENLYRTSIRQTWKSILYGTLTGGTLTGLVFGIRSRGKNLPTVGVLALFGGLAGALGGIIETVITGKSKYTRLPYDKIALENGMARQNLATMNIKGGN